jgi:hypothetical protein
MIQKWIGNDLEGSDRGVSEVLFRIVTGEMKQDHENPQEATEPSEIPEYKCRALLCINP